MKYRVSIADADFAVKTKKVVQFLSSKHMVKITIMLRGREQSHPERGESVLDRICLACESVGVPQGIPVLNGRDMILLLKPK